MHVVTLLLAIPTISTAAALMTWGMGGTFWQIAMAGIGGWLIVIVVYALQMALRIWQTDRTSSDPRRHASDGEAEARVRPIAHGRTDRGS